MITTEVTNNTLTLEPLEEQYWPTRSRAELNSCVSVHTGTVIYYTLPRTGNQWHRATMQINDERLAVAVAYRRHYLPVEATVVATEPYYRRCNSAAIS
ncbi:MAG: hypothetical protein KBT04_05880 [Bacteroidales bacterium]|nr:hypothetical protein [Candidatus Colimorpha onthohippi]